MDRRSRAREHGFQPLPARRKRFTAKIARSRSENIEKNDSRWSLLRKKPNPRGSRMQSQLQPIEIEAVIMSDHDFSIQHALRRQSRKQRVDQFGKVPVQRLLVAALNENLSPVAENERPKAIPLGLKDPVVAGRQFRNPFGKHRQHRRIHGKVHELMLSRALGEFSLAAGPEEDRASEHSAPFCTSSTLRPWARDEAMGKIRVHCRRLPDSQVLHDDETQTVNKAVRLIPIPLEPDEGRALRHGWS
jgi:hypothetical protein